MAIRYSGDTEIRFGWDNKSRVYRGTVRDPNKFWKGQVSKSFYVLNPYDSDAYDKAAYQLLKQAQKEKGKFQTEKNGLFIKIRRVFRSPCPTKMVE